MSTKTTISDLDITISQTITGITLANATSTTRTTTGVDWNGTVTLTAGDYPLQNRILRNAISENSSMTTDELNTSAQSLYEADYEDLTVLQGRTVEGTVLATKMITAINASDIDITVDDVSTLVTTIIENIA